MLEDGQGLDSWSENSDADLLMDYFSGANLKNQLIEVQRNISQLLQELVKPPIKPRDSLIEIMHEGWVYRKMSSSHGWKKNYAILVGDIIYFYKSPERDMSKAEMQVSYWSYINVEIEDELTKLQIRDGVACKMRLQLFTRDIIINLSFEGEEEADAWCSNLRKAMRRKYIKKEIEKKSDILAQLMPKFQEQTDLLESQFDLIIDALEKSGFWTSEANPKKLMEGYVHLQKSGTEEMKKMYVVLYKDYVYIFKPHDTVSMRTKPQTMINLKFIQSIEISKEDATIFVITTPIRTFRLQAKHEVAVSDWIEKIEMASNKRKGIRDNSPIAGRSTKYRGDDWGYRYNIMLQPKMIKLETLTGKRKTFKFSPKTPHASIGRSSSADITLKDDEYVSRNHCKIEIVANVPYLLDLGSGTGTFLNGEQITIAPLKPDDRITIGQTDLEFQVKISPHDFYIESPKPKKKKKRSRKDSEH